MGTHSEFRFRFRSAGAPTAACDVCATAPVSTGAAGNARFPAALTVPADLAVLCTTLPAPPSRLLAETTEPCKEIHGITSMGDSSRGLLKGRRE